MDPPVLTVYQSPFQKIRLGKANDGGYVIVDIPDIKYSLIISGGINNDISFEVDFLKKYDIPCVAFDGTIDKLPRQHKNIQFIKKNIGDVFNNKMTNLHGRINNNEHIFVKMDIEGGEIPWIKSLSDDHMNKFEQIVIEFHYPFSNKEIDVFDKINKNHVLVHFHGNNWGGTINHKGVVIPEVFECTYIHKKHFISIPMLNKESIPSHIDMKNSKRREEIYINYPPFVN